MSYGSSNRNEAMPASDSSSHLHEIIARVNNMTNSVAHCDARLERKNDQMISPPPSQQKGENSRGEGSACTRMPLVVELSKAISELETRIGRLHETILVTETI